MRTHLKRVQSTPFREKINFTKLFSMVPKVFSLGLILAWLVVLLVYGRGEYLMAVIMVGVILLLTTVISWKNGPIGGCIFVILGSGYLIFSMSQVLSLAYILAAAPLLATGSLFIVEYLYMEEKESKEEADDF
ncbi:hypothetical protein HZC32_03400 [Candidatus Woesearchaeota archaeon]|nr:hypothetical protein [Candidatus Woesearchaeota archaeon]